MHDIWNPWHGCVKCSEGCQNCYMFFLDRMRDRNGVEIPKGDLYVPQFRGTCQHCGSRLICNGCSDCGKCE